MTPKERLRKATGKLASVSKMLHDTVIDRHNDDPFAPQSDDMPAMVKGGLGHVKDAIKEIEEIVK